MDQENLIEMIKYDEDTGVGGMQFTGRVTAIRRMLLHRHSSRISLSLGLLMLCCDAGGQALFGSLSLDRVAGLFRWKQGQKSQHVTAPATHSLVKSIVRESEVRRRMHCMPCAAGRPASRLTVLPLPALFA